MSLVLTGADVSLYLAPALSSCRSLDTEINIPDFVIFCFLNTEDGKQKHTHHNVILNDVKSKKLKSSAMVSSLVTLRRI